MSSETKASTRRFLPGDFLVATPYIQDSPYRRSVVLVMRHDAQGALGFVMDNQLSANLRDISALFDSALRQRGNLNHDNLPADTVGGRKSGSALPGLRMFTAMVLWPAGKLEQEAELGVWMVTPARLDIALRSDDLWVDLVRQIGRGVLRDGLGIRKFPSNPALN